MWFLSQFWRSQASWAWSGKYPMWIISLTIRIELKQGKFACLFILQLTNFEIALHPLLPWSPALETRLDARSLSQTPLCEVCFGCFRSERIISSKIMPFNWCQCNTLFVLTFGFGYGHLGGYTASAGWADLQAMSANSTGRGVPFMNL